MSNTAELEQLAIEKESKIEYMVKGKTGRPRKYPVGHVYNKKPQDPDYFKKYYQNVTRVKENAERDKAIQTLTLEIENIKTILQKTCAASDLRVEHTWDTNVPEANTNRYTYRHPCYIYA